MAEGVQFNCTAGIAVALKSHCGFWLVKVGVEGCAALLTTVNVFVTAWFAAAKVIVQLYVPVGSPLLNTVGLSVREVAVPVPAHAPFADPLVGPVQVYLTVDI